MGGAVDEAIRDRQERAARNQSLWREVNERVEDVAPSDSMSTAFICECANLECFDKVSLTLEEYEAVRRWPSHFFVTPGHVYPEAERIVDDVGADGSRYQVVEKFGEAGKVAIALDARRQPATGR
jgi:hypothetical protein